MPYIKKHQLLILGQAKTYRVLLFYLELKRLFVVFFYPFVKFNGISVFLTHAHVQQLN